MNHRLVILLSLLVSVSCEDRLWFSTPKEEKILNVNGLLDTSDSLHTLRVAYATSEKAIPAEDVSVLCHVNGREVPVDAGERKGDFLFRAELRPSDLVSLRVVSPGTEAFTESVVPRQAEIGTVQVTRDGEVFVCRIEVRDIPEEDSFYRLDIRGRQRVYGRQSGLEYKSEGALAVDPSGDPVLGKSRVSDRYSYQHLEYNGVIFSDEAFRDGRISFTVRVGLNQLDEPYFWYSLEGSPVDYHGISSLVVKLSSIPREDYELTEYFRFQWDDLYDNLGFLSYFEEEGVYPNNVENAIGNVFVRSSVSQAVDILEMDYTSDDPGHPSITWKVPSE